jgi:hypothetical protein
MKANRRRDGEPSSRGGPAPTTADGPPVLARTVLALPAGDSLDDLVGRHVLALPQGESARGVSSSWDGAARVTARMTALGCYLELQVHRDQCLCRVRHVLQGNAVSRQLASATAGQLPEAVAKAALIACLGMEPG